MHICDNEEDFLSALSEALQVTEDHPVLLDRFLVGATEYDVDALCDGESTYIAGIMEHIEEAGIHSGDSACVIPTFSLSDNMRQQISAAAKNLAVELKVRGLMNIQFAVKEEELYVIEVNPRASRTVPFVSKAIGTPLAKLAAKVMAGEKLVDLGFNEPISPEHYSVKEAVFPFSKFPGIDISLGPEMKSTGEVMGIDADLGMAYAKSQMAASSQLPLEGKIFFSVKDRDKEASIPLAKEFANLGFELYSTSGTARTFEEAGIKVNTLHKLAEGRPNVLDMIKNSEIAMVINTPSGRVPRRDEVRIRSGALAYRVPIITTMRGAQAAIRSIKSLKAAELSVVALQEFHM